MSTQKPTRTRYAPSPTGFFHVGGARTALYSYLLARQTGGQFILRIEDTDQTRYNPESLTNLLGGLRFLGLDWDEGPDIGGDYGPYIQTERRSIYTKYIQPLLDEGKVYRCFCTKERLTQIRAERQKANIIPWGYDRHCRNIPPATSTERAAKGETHVIRLKVPLAGSVTMKDFLRGDITMENATLQDDILIKSDGLPTYAFAAMVDDHLMKITHVLRDEQWISSFAIHWHVIAALGWEPPHFVHLPIILTPSGKGKMSKREGRAPDGKIHPVFVERFAELGYLPEALINFMALVGWSYDDKTEVMNLAELVERFSLERINKTPASWDYDKLDHFNGLYIRELAVDELGKRLLPFLQKAGLSVNEEQLRPITPLIQDRLTTLADGVEQIRFFFSEVPDYPVDWLIPRKTTAEEVIPILEKAKAVLSETDFKAEVLESTIKATVKDLGIKMGQMFQPLRVAVSGVKGGPPMFEILAILGRDTVQSRLDEAIAKLLTADD